MPTVTCIHLGWQALRGREEIMHVWRQLLNQASATPVVCRDAEAFVKGKVAFVVLL